MNRRIETQLLKYNFFYEMLQQDVSIQHYKNLQTKSNIEHLFLKEAKEEDNVLIFTLYCAHNAIMNKMRDTKTLKRVSSKLDIYMDILSNITLFSTLYLLLNDFLNRSTTTISEDRIYVLYQLCKKFYFLGDELSSLYVKDGDFLEEVEKSFVELVRLQSKSKIDVKIVELYVLLSNAQTTFIKKDFMFFDIFKSVGEALIPFCFSFPEKGSNPSNKVHIYSTKPFIYFSGKTDNFINEMILYFVKKDDLVDSEIDKIKLDNINNTSVAMIFALFKEHGINEFNAYKSLALSFFVNNDNVAKYAYLERNGGGMKVHMQRFYNSKILKSNALAKTVEDELMRIHKGNKNDIVFLLKEFSRKIPLIASEKNWFVADEKNIEFEDEFALRLYSLFIEFIQKKEGANELGR